MNGTKKIVILALLTSVGIVLGIIENAIPLPIRVPGAKIGLSNVVQLVVIVTIGYREGILIAVLKSVLIAIGTGNISSIMYSLPSAVSSTLAMIAVYSLFRDKFSLIGVSIFGALAHNLVQISVAALIIGNIRVYTYYPLLSLIATFTGYFTGLTAMYFQKQLSPIYAKNKK